MKNTKKARFPIKNKPSRIYICKGKEKAKSASKTNLARYNKMVLFQILSKVFGYHKKVRWSGLGKVSLA
jgi:hypothetical protein